MSLSARPAEGLNGRERVVFDTHLESALIAALDQSDASGSLDKVSEIVRARVREQRSVGVPASALVRDVRYAAVSALAPATASLESGLVALRLIDKVVLVCVEEYSRAD